MNENIVTRFKKAWNVFLNPNRSNINSVYGGYYSRPDRPILTKGNERSIVTSVINKISLDVASIDIKHCKIDSEGRFKEVLNTELNDRLTLEANIDQTSRFFIQDLMMTMLDKGVAAIVPVDTSVNPKDTSSYDIYSMRVGIITAWFPAFVKVSVYNDRKGRREEICIAKDKVAIIENPLYSVMNEPNSTLQRLMRKLVLLDSVDEQTSSGKLDLIIQLPYTVKSELRKQQASERRQEIERQLTGSRYGIAYIDGTEKITQLNRPIESNLMKQIEYLTSMLYSQLGISQSVLDGTADETVLNNYYNRTIEPFISAITNEIDRKFISKTARSQGHKILFFRDPFRLIPISKIGEIADSFTRNEILTSNEVRQIIGRKPSDDPKADQLINSNINQSNTEIENRYGVKNEDGNVEQNPENVQESFESNTPNSIVDYIREEIQNGKV